MSTTPKSGAYALYSHLTIKAGRTPMFYTEFIRHVTLGVMHGADHVKRTMLRNGLDEHDINAVLRAGAECVRLIATVTLTQPLSS